MGAGSVLGRCVSDGGAKRRPCDRARAARDRAREGARPIAGAKHLDERAPDRVDASGVASSPVRERDKLAWSGSRAAASSSSSTAERSGQVSPSSARSAARSCSARKGSFWKSDSSQRSSASASAGSPSASPSAASTLDGDRRRGSESSRDGSPGGCVAAIGSTGRMPNGRPSSVSKRTGPAASGAAVASRSALTASAISAGASGGSSPRVELRAKLEDAVPVGLAPEAAAEAARATRASASTARRRRTGARQPGRELDRASRPTARSAARRARTCAARRTATLELRVGALERLVVPVEPAARLGGRRAGARAARCGRARRPRSGAGRHARARRSPPPARAELLEGEARVLARAQQPARAPRRTPARAGGTRTAPARARWTCSSKANGSSAPSSSSRRRTRTRRGRSRGAADRDAARVRRTLSAYAAAALGSPLLEERSSTALRPQHGPARAGEEAGLDEQRERVRLDDGLAVETLDREPLRAAGADVGDERLERRPQPRRRPGSRSGTSERPPRSTKSAASPSSRTTQAPATRAARAPARRGHGSAAPYGWAGSAAASTSALGSSSSRPPRSSRSRSTAPGSANCAPPSPSTKYPRRQTPSVSSARSSPYTAP